MRDSSNIMFYSFLFGPFLLSWGMASLRKKRLMENVPKSQIRSAAMGLVELHGTAKPRKETLTPFSRLPCCWWCCTVEEKGSKNRWHTLREVQCQELFYLEDDTGKALVDPTGAELHNLDGRTIYPSSDNRSSFNAALASWGIKADTFLGLNRTLRVREQFIAPESPLYVLGELGHRGNYLEEKKQRYLDHLRASKSDAAKMAEADANKDGVVDAAEWDAYRLKQEEEFLKKELEREALVPASDKLVVRLPQDRPFLISPSEAGLKSRLWWGSLLGTTGGVALNILAVWLAQSQGLSPALILGIVAGGLVASFFLSKIKLRKVRSLIP